jgi:hypothetical protein
MDDDIDVNQKIMSGISNQPLGAYTYGTNGILPPSTGIGNINYTITTSPNTGSHFFYNNATTTSNPSLKVAGDADFEGDVKIKGKSLLTLLEGIEKRLSILNPDPEKLEKYEALKKAYEHYKTLEALCEIQDKENE